MTHTPLAGERLQPLGHVSERGNARHPDTLQVFFVLFGKQDSHARREELLEQRVLQYIDRGVRIYSVLTLFSSACPVLRQG